MITMPHSIWDAMRSHVAGEMPLEACGLLSGSKDKVQNLYRIPNALQSPVRFRMNAQAQLAAFEAIEADGQDILAIYHSHPQGPAYPSATDLAEAAYDVVYLIWSFADGVWHLNAFALNGNSASPVPFRLTDE